MHARGGNMAPFCIGFSLAIIAGPLVGGPVGATLYDLLIRGVPASEEQPVLYDEATIPA